MRRSATADLRARLEPWAAGTTLSPVARPSRRRCAPLQDEDERVGWPVCCKQQRIYKAPLMQTPDTFGRRAQFQLWIFSWHILAHSPKKYVSRVLLLRGRSV